MNSNRLAVLENAIAENERVKMIYDKGMEDFNHVQTLISRNRLRIPIPYRNIVKKVFELDSHPTISTSEDTNRWLKSNLIESEEVCDFDIQPEALEKYDDMLKYLIKTKNGIKVMEKSILFRQIVWGYYLERFCDMQDSLYQQGSVYKTLKNVLFDEFRISDSYARRLRWIGKLGNKYIKFQRLALPLSQLIKKRKQIDVMLKDTAIANQWK